MPRGLGDRAPEIGRETWEASHLRRKACHDDPAHRVCSGCHRDIRSNRRVGFLLRPRLQNRRHCSGRTFIRLDRRFVHVRAGSRFSLLTAAANASSRQHGSASAEPRRADMIGVGKWVKHRSTHHRSTSAKSIVSPRRLWPGPAPTGSPRPPEGARRPKPRRGRLNQDEAVSPPPADPAETSAARTVPADFMARMIRAHAAHPWARLESLGEPRPAGTCAHCAVGAALAAASISAPERGPRRFDFRTPIDACRAKAGVPGANVVISWRWLSRCLPAPQSGARRLARPRRHRPERASAEPGF
jgi:hypothetical protein